MENLGLILEKYQEIGVNLIRQGYAHAVRCPGVHF